MNHGTTIRDITFIYNIDRIRVNFNLQMTGGTKRKYSAKSAESVAALTTSRTNSFDACWAGSFDPTTNIKVHTLILGTHPSITSLEKKQYYGHPMNSFWWIAGDCLGFRRDSAMSPSSGKPYIFESKLRYGLDRIIPYEEQVKVLVNHGFALWDVIASCERPNSSLDADIVHEIPNDIRTFCQVHHPSIRRIVLANGVKQSELFAKHFKTWWESGSLRPMDVGHVKASSTSIKAFQKFSKMTNHFHQATIECVVGPGVSPAAAGLPYEKKRDFYEIHCYLPGLNDHKELN